MERGARRGVSKQGSSSSSSTPGAVVAAGAVVEEASSRAAVLLLHHHRPFFQGRSSIYSCLPATSADPIVSSSLVVSFRHFRHFDPPPARAQLTVTIYVSKHGVYYTHGMAVL